MENKALTIAVCMPIWKRHEITKHVLENYRKLMEDINIIPIIVGSEGDVSKKLAKGMEYIEAPNNPLSDKWNIAFKRAKELNVDACVIAASDTIINKNYFAEVFNTLSNGNIDYFGVSDAYYLYANIVTYWPGYSNHRKGEPIGDGRMMSKGLLEKLGWQPFDRGLNRGLDGSFTNKLRRRQIVTKTIKQKGIMICGLRSDVQITITDIKAENSIDLKILKHLKRYEPKGT